MYNPEKRQPTYNNAMDNNESTLLGRQTPYPDTYSPELLQPMERAPNRHELGAAAEKFAGCDIWHAWELSWLNDRGRPVNAVGRFVFDCSSPFLVESKSFKLYLNSLAFTKFAGHQAVVELLQKDLSQLTRSPVGVELIAPDDSSALARTRPDGLLLDRLDIAVDEYDRPRPDFLAADDENTTSETLVSHLFRSNCPVTNQPDWASMQIRYRGPAVDHAGLLRYLVSWRRHSGFHEHCAEQIFCDIRQRCRPQELDILACFTRRGGLDITPWRSSRSSTPPAWVRSLRQ